MANSVPTFCRAPVSSQHVQRASFCDTLTTTAPAQPSVCLLVVGQRADTLHANGPNDIGEQVAWRTVVSQDAPADFVSRLGLSGHVTYDCFACIQIEFDIILTVVSRCSHGKHVRLYIHDQLDINIISDPALALHLLSSYLPLVRWTLLLNCAASLGPMNLHH